MYAELLRLLLLFLLLLLLLLLTVVIVRRRGTEGFSAMSEQKDFGSTQTSYFKSLDNAVLTNPGIDPTLFNKAAVVPDLYNYVKKVQDYIPRFMTDTYTDYEQRNKFCKDARHPRYLPTRERKETTGCGWYFSPDPSIPSVGILGNREKPHFTDNLPPNGTWIWHIPEAIEQEDIKFCSNIRSCDVMDVEGVRGVCGFCLSSGHAVPIDTNGREKYPNNPKGVCGAEVHRTAYDCLHPPNPPVRTSEGLDCKQYGYPSELNDIRLYSRDECNALNGTWYGDGECLKPKGGSFSWDCRALNMPKPSATSVCTPTNEGRLTRNCLMTLAKGVGCTPTGSILSILQQSGTPTPNEREAMRLLASVGVAIPDSVLGSGAIDAVSAGNVYKRVVDQIQRGNTEQIRNAAKLLVHGGEYDTCNLDRDARGPFAKYCVQRAFRLAGCQPAGSEYPTTDMSTNKVWGMVLDEYKQLYAAMNNDEDSDEQKIAIQKCLGIRVPDIECKK